MRYPHMTGRCLRTLGAAATSVALMLALTPAAFAAPGGTGVSDTASPDSGTPVAESGTTASPTGASQEATETITAQGTAVTITVGSDGKPTAAAGTGWTYDGSALELRAGYDFTIAGGTCTCDVRNTGNIVDGSFSAEVYDLADGTISGGTFTGDVGCLDGAIEGGTFSGSQVNLLLASSIEDGTFNCPVKVNNTGNNGGVVSGGTFNGAVDVWGSVTEGTFNAPVTIEATALVNGGTFQSTVTNAGTISGGTYWGLITTRGDGDIEYENDVRQGVTHSLTGITSDGGAVIDVFTPYMETLTAAPGYVLPESITVTLDGQVAVAGVDYDWDPSTGELLINPTYASDTMSHIGPMTITAVATPATPASAGTTSTLPRTGDSALPWVFIGISLSAAASVFGLRALRRRDRGAAREI